VGRITDRVSIAKIKTMYLIGAGGHAKVVIDILRANSIKIAGIYDSTPYVETLFGIPFLGSEDGVVFMQEEVIVTIGNNATRKKVANKLSTIAGIAISKQSMVADTVTVSDGTVIAPGAIVQTHSVIGRHVIVNTAANIDHDCEINDFVHISPGAVLCGNVHVGEGTQIGAGAVCIPDVKIGKWCTIGAGTVVTKDIPDYAVAVGVPARIIKYNNFQIVLLR
jgi:acetyltransferase EpsM